MISSQLKTEQSVGCVPTIAEVVQQLADNCSFLWLQREMVANSRIYASTFEDLTEIDERIDAQLDGLRCSGTSGWKTAAEALALKGTGEVFTAAVLAFESSGIPEDSTNSARLEAIFTRAEDVKDFVRPACLALHWISPEKYELAVRWLFEQEASLCQAVAITGASARGLDCSREIESAIRSDNDHLAQAGLRASARTSYRHALPVIEERLVGNDTSTIFAAAESGCLLGSKKARDLLLSFSSDEISPFAERAASLLFHALDPEEAARMHSALFGKSLSRAAVWAAASTGIREMGQFMLDAIADEEFTKLASELFSLLWGVPVQRRERTPREGVMGPSEDPEDHNVAIDPDHGRFDPEGSLVSSWWHEHAAEFAPTVRYLRGQPITPETLMQCLGSGPQMQRFAAAELLALSGRLTPAFDVSAPAFRQSQRWAEISWG
jgi:uncharacterized protein (TIGR02270 family)